MKLASGSWIRVLSLFWEDPQLALHKDFLTGYTALHWIAKHTVLSGPFRTWSQVHRKQGLLLM